MYIVQIFQKDGGSKLLARCFQTMDDAKRVAETREDVVRAVVYKVTPGVMCNPIRNFSQLDTVAQGIIGGFKWTEF